MKLRPDSGPAKRTSVRRAYKRSVAALSRVHALPLRDSKIGCLLSKTVSHRQQSTGALLANLLKLSKLSQSRVEEKHTISSRFWAAKSPADLPREEAA